VGLLYKSENNFMVGLSYRSEVRNELKGDFDISDLPTGDESYDDSEMTLKTPGVVNFGISADVGKRMKLYSNVSYTQWSIFEYLNISYNNGTEVNEKQAWKDSWSVATGADVRLDEIFSARLGIGIEQKAPYAVLSPTTPDSDRVIGSVGLGVDYKRVDVDFSFSRYFMNDIEMKYSSQTSASYLDASYTPAQYYFGMSVSYSI
jgi:long-chain fatty acid transport protein